MPYFVYRIGESRSLEHIATFTAYKEAREQVRAMRAEAGGDSVNSIRMIFARNETEAETLLSTPREPRVIGED